MKSIYITSVERNSGKTAFILAFGRKLINDGYKVGYLKPLSTQPWRIGQKITDEDAAFVKEILGLPMDPWEISPVVVTRELLSERLQMSDHSDLLDLVIKKSKEASTKVDVMLYEGGCCLREGYVVGMPATAVAEALESQVLAIIPYRDRVRLLDDALAAKTRLGSALRGIIINRIPSDASDFITNEAIPYLSERNIPVFGKLPEARALEALTIQEIYDALKAVLLTESYKPDTLVEALMIGAMTADAALSRFRKQANKAVITGGDRSDIQLAALETSTACLILTGNLHPSPLVIKQAEDLGVAIFLVPTSTMETIENLENIFGKTRMGQHAKLEKFEQLVDQNVNFSGLYKALGI